MKWLDIDTAPTRPVPFYQGGLLQFLNLKACLMALGAVAGFSLSDDAYSWSVIAINIVIAAVNIVSGAIWLVFGKVIRRLLKGRRAWILFNLAIGLLTEACVLLIWR